MGASLSPSPSKENPGKGELSPWAAVELMAAIALSFPRVEAITSWRRFWNGRVPKRSVLGDSGDGVAPPQPGSFLQGARHSPVSLGTGCHLEGQGAFCSGTPTWLGRSHLNRVMVFCCVFCCCCCSKTSPVFRLGRGWWWGTGHPLAGLSPKQTVWGAQREPFCRAGGPPACGGPGLALLARPRPPALGLWYHLPSAQPWRSCGAELRSGATSPSRRATISRGAAALC